MAPKKVLFLTIPFKGHLVHTCRLAEWFLQFPEDYEIHIGVPAECFPSLPEGVTTHEMDPLVSSKSMGAAMAKSGVESKNWIHSQVIMMDGLDGSLLQALFISGIKITEEVKPDIVVCDHSVNVSNTLYTACDKLKIPLVQITSMGRPETITQPANMCKMLCCHLPTLMKVLKTVSGIEKAVAEHIGVPKLIPDSQKPITLLPSSECLVETDPGPHAIFTGPFLPFPGLVQEQRRSLRRQSTFSMQIDGAPDLQAWLSKGDQTMPIVYVALGTLVTPTEAMMHRIVDGLDRADRWRVIWALPEEHRVHLPKELGPNWFLMTFAPQFALLKSGRISAFLSHCGANSTMESLCQGVPMLCMPFFGDQYEWQLGVCNHAKAGVPIDKNETTSSQIAQAVEKVLFTPMYRENARYMQKQMLLGSLGQLKFLQEHWVEKEVKIEKDMKVGIPIAAGIIDAVMHGKDPHARLPRREVARRCC